MNASTQPGVIGNEVSQSNDGRLLEAVVILPMAASGSELGPGTITPAATSEQNAVAGVTRIYANAVEHA